MKKYLVYLNVFAAFAVVILHTNFVFWYFSYEPYWIKANVIESVFYFAVPIFVMITGANLIGYSQKYSTESYAEKRINKTVIPFLVWTCIAYVVSLYKNPDNLPVINIVTIQSQLKWIVVCGVVAIIYKIAKQAKRRQIITLVLKVLLTLACIVTVIKIVDTDTKSVWEIINNILHTQYQAVYWYFIPLFAVYIAIPMFEAIPEKNRQKVFGTIISTVFIFGFLVTFIIPFIPSLTYNHNLMLPFQSYMWYALVGYYIDHYSIKKLYRYIIYLLGILGLGLHLFGTQFASLQSGEVSMLFKGYLNLPAILYSVAIFTAFKYLPEYFYTGKLWTICLRLSKTTFGIYLIHILIIEILRTTTTLDFKRLSVRLIASFFIFIGSALLVTIYSNSIRFIKKQFKHIKNKNV